MNIKTFVEKRLREGAIFGMIVFGLLMAAYAFVFYSWSQNAKGPIEGVIAEIGRGKNNLHWPIYEFQAPTGLIKTPSLGIPGFLNQTSSLTPSYKVGDPINLYYRLSGSGEYEVIEASYLDPTWFKIGTGMSGLLFFISFLIFIKFRTA